ncbi:hypothetical protein ER57_12585 [Smithella sp. SCADC]|nr:hypothetical protein ER57_12585 [Smithella sp. SCADC]
MEMIYFFTENLFENQWNINSWILRRVLEDKNISGFPPEPCGNDKTRCNSIANSMMIPRRLGGGAGGV